MYRTKPANQCEQDPDNAFSSQEQIHTKKDPTDEGMRIESVLVGDISKRQHVQLLQAITTGGVNRQENGQSDQRAHEANDHANLHESKEQVAIDRVVLKHVLIFEGGEWFDPVKEAIRKARRTVTTRQPQDLAISATEREELKFIALACWSLLSSYYHARGQPLTETPTYGCFKFPRYVLGAYCLR
jgi:hypothetical protein